MGVNSTYFPYRLPHLLSTITTPAAHTVPRLRCRPSLRGGIFLESKHMTTLLCPDCGHDVYSHYIDGCEVGWVDNKPPCMCKRNYLHALFSYKQRAAAIAHLRHYGLLACKWRKAQSNKELTSIQRDFLYKCEMDTMNKIYFAIAAYRAVGILPKPKERKP